MPPIGLLADGFWLCLRPSFTTFVHKPRPLPFLKLLPRIQASKQCYSTQAEFEQPPSPSPDGLLQHGSNSDLGLSNESPAYSVTRPKKTLKRKEAEPVEVYEARMRMLPRKISSDSHLQTKSRGFLEYLLQRVIGEQPSHQATLRLLHELLGRRRLKPQSHHYRAMVLANADARFGSAVHVRKLLEEMEDTGIPVDSGTLHAALRTLAIHPDFLLRQEVLHTLRDRWLSLSPAGWHNHITGLLRERQYELALDKLEQMETQGIPVKSWLYALVVYNLADAQEFDEVYTIMQARVAAGGHFSPNLWFHILDMASAAMHTDLTKYIWKHQVQRGYLIPSYGVCSNVLAICARTGDVDLAISVFDALGQRNATLTVNDYESLLDTYVTAGDVTSALRVLCTMEKTNVDAWEDSTRSLLSSLLLSETKASEVWQALKHLQTEEHQTIPLVAANLAIEICAYRGVTDEGMEIYRELHTVCSVTPDTSTFNHLLEMSHKAQDFKAASFFLQEMQLFKVLPNRFTYQILILLCVERGSFEDGRKYLIEMTESGFSLTEAAKKQVREMCAKSTDQSAMLLQYDAALRAPKPRVFRRSPFKPLINDVHPAKTQ